MARPRRFLVRMILFLLAVSGLIALLFIPLRNAFIANAPLNGLILGVLLLGIIYNFRQVMMLYPEVAWIESFRRQPTTLSQPKAPKLLASMATMLGERKNKDTLSLSTMAMRSLLDGIYSRLDESRDLSRYNIGLLIFLGLLGTFWGLLETVSSISNVIGGLSVGEPEQEREEVLAHTLPHLPSENPRYLMGVGRPQDIIAAVQQGVDMFDCVMPTDRKSVV